MELFSDDNYLLLHKTSVERRVHECLKIGSVAVKCAAVASYCVFLATGDYNTLLYRLAGIQLVSE